MIYIYRSNKEEREKDLALRELETRLENDT